LEEASVADEKATRLSDGLAKTRTGFISKLGELFKGEKLNENLVDEIEEVLFTADIGTSAANDILHAVQSQLNSDQKQDPKTVWAFVRQYVLEKLKAREEALDLERHHPFVILVVGVNGVGKTTTIGKLASKFKKQGKSVLMVAGDTFRAAAVEQLGVWGERTDIAVHQGEPDSDPSSVIYAGIERGVKEGVDIIICDTAGRLHTKVNLLDELRKMNRVASKVIASAPHETILVLDANTGQNAIQQAKLFSEAVDISGIVLTKLDGTAKGGVILGICEELNAPIRYIGIGESVSDLRSFSADEFVEALFM
jgi:fused signal recognition particle receptor